MPSVRRSLMRLQSYVRATEREPHSSLRPAGLCLLIVLRVGCTNDLAGSKWARVGHKHRVQGCHFNNKCDSFERDTQRRANCRARGRHVALSSFPAIEFITLPFIIQCLELCCLPPPKYTHSSNCTILLTIPLALVLYPAQRHVLTKSTGNDRYDAQQ